MPWGKNRSLGERKRSQNVNRDVRVNELWLIFVSSFIFFYSPIFLKHSDIIFYDENDVFLKS